MFAYNWDLENCPLYGVERWLQSRGFLSTILNGGAVRTKVSVCHRQGGHSSEVVVKRGSTVYPFYIPMLMSLVVRKDLGRTPEYGIGTNTQILYKLSQILLFDIL